MMARAAIHGGFSGTIAVVLAALAPAGALAHGTHGGVSGPMSHAGAGIATLRPDESLKLSIDFFGYVNGSAAAGWRTGEPLGAGGKIPFFYNQWLYREGPFERTALAKKDFWPQYRDFSYIPLWQPSQLGMRTQYRLVPTLQATFTVVYFGSLDRITVEPNPIEIEELFARWSPEAMPGLSFSFGHLLLVGSYSEPFDQFPLESFQLNGVAVEYERDVAAGAAELRWQLAGGRTPLGRTTQVDVIDPEPSRNHPFLDGVRERTHIYATAAAGLRSGLSVGVIGGYQILPADQSTTNDPVPQTMKWPRSSGWHAGVELGFARGQFAQRLTVAHGWGDVEMGWGAPDYVYYDDATLMDEGFTREGSRLLQAVYWGQIARRALRVRYGAWGQWRRPAPAQRMWSVFDNLSQQVTQVLARTENFRALKLNLEPAVALGKIAAVGVRLDSIHYFDKKATTNTIEPQVDEALRPIMQTDANGMVAGRLEGPSRWEREAVDCLIVSPFVDLLLGDAFRLRGSWSGAWYTDDVHRQRKASSFHGNVTISLWMVHRFGIPADGG
jgi:hypothetical protein